MNTNTDHSTSKKILLTGGRAPATLDLARQLYANGHVIYVAESCSAHLCRPSRAVVKSFKVPMPKVDRHKYIDALQSIIQAEQIDWLIPTCEEIFYISAGLSQLTAYCEVFCDDLTKLERLHHKFTFIERVKQHGLQAPHTILIQNRKSFEAIATNGEDRSWVFKPTYSRFSTNVFTLQTNRQRKTGRIPQKSIYEAKKTIFKDKESLLKNEAWVGQQRIEGQAYCSYSVVKQGEIMAHTVYPVEFTAGIGACISFTAIRHEQIEDWVNCFVAKERFTGQIAFDFIVTADGTLYPIECNPRTTGGIHLFRATDKIDQAFLQNKESSTSFITPHPQRKAYLLLAMCSFGFISIRSWSSFKRWLSYFSTGKDIVFRWKDPFPFFQQIIWIIWSIRISMIHNISIIDASTFDIEWNGREREKV